MNTSEKTISSSETAEEILKNARQKVDTQKPKSQSSSSSSDSAEKRPRQLVKASQRVQQQSGEVIQKFVETSEVLNRYDAAESLERGRDKARRQVEYEQLGYVGELTKLRVQAAKSCHAGLRSIEEKADEKLGEDEAFADLFQGGNQDPLDQAKKLFAEVELSKDSTDIFHLAGN